MRKLCALLQPSPVHLSSRKALQVGCNHGCSLYRDGSYAQSASFTTGVGKEQDSIRAYLVEAGGQPKQYPHLAHHDRISCEYIAIDVPI